MANDRTRDHTDSGSMFGIMKQLVCISNQFFICLQV